MNAFCEHNAEFYNASPGATQSNHRPVKGYVCIYLSFLLLSGDLFPLGAVHLDLPNGTWRRISSMGLIYIPFPAKLLSLLYGRNTPPPPAGTPLPRATRIKIVVSGTSNRLNCGIVFVVCVM